MLLRLHFVQYLLCHFHQTLQRRQLFMTDCSGDNLLQLNLGGKLCVFLEFTDVAEGEHLTLLTVINKLLKGELQVNLLLSVDERVL